MPASPSVTNKKSPPTQFHDKIDYFNHVANNNNNNNNNSSAALVPGGVVTTQNISTVIKPKGNENSLQFVKIQTPELSKKAVEQIRLAEDSKISKNKIKEVEEEWQNNLLSWKSKRRQQFPTTTTADNDHNNSSFDSGDGANGRKFKTFAEMIEQRAKSGNRLSFHLQRYVGDDGYEAEGDVDEERNEQAEDETRAAEAVSMPRTNKELQDLANDDSDIKDDQNDKVSDTSDLVSDETDDIVSDLAPKPIVDNRCETTSATTLNDNHLRLSNLQIQQEKGTNNISIKNDASSGHSSFEDIKKSSEMHMQNNAWATTKGVAPQPPPPPPIPYLPKQQKLTEYIPNNIHQNVKTPDVRTSKTSASTDSSPSQELNRLERDDDIISRDVVDKLNSPGRTPIKAAQPTAKTINNKPLEQSHHQRQSTPNPPPQFSQSLPETPKSTPSQRKLLKDHLRDDNEKPFLSVSGKKRCSSCREELGRGAAAFVVESLSLVYHTNCFRCSVCHANLANGFKGVNVRVHAGALHCHNCYSKDGLNYSRV